MLWHLYFRRLASDSFKYFMYIFMIKFTSVVVYKMYNNSNNISINSNYLWGFYFSLKLFCLSSNKVQR